ncbi:MAG: TonB-dependent receptor [Bacteroidales bacterium]|nr:TonB-dependent receptor [Bacteroidales bacterium]MCF8403372.1 TonB-dependent receptor [Bacteroidales bacterium]
MIKVLYIIGLTFIFLQAFSQQPLVDTVYKLPDFKVIGSRIDNYSAGQKIRRIDSLELIQDQSSNLGELITRNTSVHINTYSYNGLSQISFRGTSTSQTGIYWNGFALNQPNHGQIDLALIPSGYFNDVEILYGGGSSLFGSGNIGGSILLNSQPNFKKHLIGDIETHLASFAEKGLNGGLSYSNSKWYFKTKFLGKSARNNFPYKSLAGEEEKLKNADLEQFGFIQDIYFSAGKNWVLGGSVWYQQNDKKLPATLTTKASDASQFDWSVRSFVSAKKYLKNGSLSLKTALLNDFSHYVDPDPVPELNIDSEIKTLKLITEIQFEYKLHDNILVTSGMNYSNEQGESIYYPGRVEQIQVGAFLLWSLNFPSIQWKFNANLRQDLIWDFTVPFTPAFGFEGKIFPFLAAKFNVSRNFRAPSFNDRYWVPGGNTDLQPEDSWNEELSLLLDFEWPLLKNKTGITFSVFNSNVDNWILWVPDGLLWSAQNVQQVWSRGIESDINLSFQIKKIVLKLNGGLSLVKSTNEIQASGNDQSFLKQLIYVPEHKYFATALIRWESFMFSYNQSYTGQRFITKDNKEALPAYALDNIWLSKVFEMKQNKVEFAISLNNIWDIEYQAVQYNPMPGRHFRISIKLLLNKF